MRLFAFEIKRVGLNASLENDPYRPSILVSGQWDGEALDFGVALDNVLVEAATGEFVLIDIDAAGPRATY